MTELEHLRIQKFNLELELESRKLQNKPTNNIVNNIKLLNAKIREFNEISSAQIIKILKNQKASQKPHKIVKINNKLPALVKDFNEACPIMIKHGSDTKKKLKTLIS